jgi:hypothetical protein
MDSLFVEDFREEHAVKSLVGLPGKGICQIVDVPIGRIAVLINPSFCLQE